MIAFANNLPVVRFKDGRIMPFERDWLAGAVAKAAGNAGYPKWWLTDHVCESVSSYLVHDHEECVIDCEILRNSVVSVLTVIGYADVADHFQTPAPAARLSLFALARVAGSGYELAFFSILQEQLRETLRSAPERVELTDLKPCVKTLRSAKNWRFDCARLMAEIVRFVQCELRACGHREIELRMS